MTQPNWRDEAACRHVAPELFFPIGTTGAAIVEIEEAKRVCAVCPVQSQCLEFALRTRQEFGIWGGTTEEERRLLVKVIRAKAKARTREEDVVPV
jgi:WhiB family transcriptional regulator, redox-sensing transcriptional regulator